MEKDNWMKTNVDLTEKRDFSSRRIDKAFIQNRFRRFPWSRTNFGGSNMRNELIYTGTSTERKRKKAFKLFEDGKSCERCGIDLANMPWNMKGLLCRTCDELLEEEVRRKENLLVKTSRIFK